MSAPLPLPAPTVTGPDGAPITTLTYTNQGDTHFRWEPERVQIAVDAAAWRASLPTIDAVQIELPAGWRRDSDAWRSVAGESLITWQVTPIGAPDTFAAGVTVLALSAAEELGRADVRIPIAMHGHSQFDPARDSLSVANSSRVLGRIGPDPQVFRATYGVVPASEALFDGLYRSIVFIGGDGQGYGGGLCSGMARAALQRSLTGHGPEPTIDEVMLWHGRQLTDRALLASAPWFFVPSPRRAYEHFREQVLTTGTSDLCFDIAVPRPLRRDLATALMEEGHTVVPYAFRQSNETRAEVLVYDPNHPEPDAWAESVITFDLASDTYAYRHLASLDDRSITIIAAPQSAYARGRTAILASLASLVLFPRARETMSPRLWRAGLVIVVALLAVVGLALVRARRQPQG